MDTTREFPSDLEDRVKIVVIPVRRLIDFLTGSFKDGKLFVEWIVTLDSLDNYP